MSQPRKPTKASIDAIAGPTSDDPTYVTAEWLADNGYSDRMTAQTISDARIVHTYVSANPWVRRDALVRWAHAQWGRDSVDRLNDALALLQSAGKVVEI